MSEQQELAPKGALRQLALDIIESLGCRCYTEDLSREDDCPCGGDGRGFEGDPDPFMGCFVCQARSAVADDSQQTAPAADPHPVPIPPAAGAAHVESGAAPPPGEDPR